MNSKRFLSENNTRTETDCVLCLALDIGKGLLKNGDSVHHVEETIKMICLSYGGEHIETFVISSLILASVRMKDGTYSSQIRRIYNSTNNMLLLEAYNGLSRRICEETPDFETAQILLKEIKAKYSYPLWLTILGNIFAAAGFAVLFGGSIRDGLAGGVVGLAIGLLSFVNMGNINALAKLLILSFMAGLLSYTTILMGIGQNVDMVMIGSIMLLIPGLALGNALRDLLCGDILTGTLRTIQSCLTAILIACGYSCSVLAMSGWNLHSGIPIIEYHFFVRLVLAILGTAAFAAVFRVRLACLWITALVGGGVYSVFCLCEQFSAPEFIASVCCSVFGAILAEICARFCCMPAIIFYTPGIISIVPGGALYYTMSALVAGDYPLLLSKATQTLSISSGLVVGSMIVGTMVMMIRQNRKKRLK